MDYLDFPQEALWESRRDWFESLTEAEENKSCGYSVSDQACALMADAQVAFCSGAWVSVIILCFTVIDAQLRETEVPGFKGNSKELLCTLGFDDRFQALRIRRNQLIHIDEENPGVSIDQLWSSQNELELEARTAVELMIEAFYANPLV